MQRLTLTALSLALLASPVLAEDMPAPFMNVITTGVICDTPEQVEIMLSEIALTDGFPDHEVEGCGMLRGAMPALITPMRWYETPGISSLIASYVAPNGWTQYGWIEFVIHDDVQPASVEQEL